MEINAYTAFASSAKQFYVRATIKYHTDMHMHNRDTCCLALLTTRMATNYLSNRRVCSSLPAAATTTATRRAGEMDKRYARGSKGMDKQIGY